jgi:hypothetical protein
VLAELAVKDHRQQACPGPRPGDDVEWRRRLGDLLASPARELLAHRLDHFPLARHHDALIDYLPSLRGDPIQFYSCFISYSAKDQVFAERLHADVQNKGVRCWFAPHDLPIGAKTWDEIDEAIRLRDKLLVVLSRAALDSDWVEDEVTKAYAEERTRKEVVLFPIRIDNTVMSTAEPWAIKLRDQRNIGDFRQWKKPAEYLKGLELPCTGYRPPDEFLRLSTSL